ncbi:MAG: hypothetical protein RLZZ292_873 [Bacteroidota bacterium]|jgi:hypothetical protein
MAPPPTTLTANADTRFYEIESFILDDQGNVIGRKTILRSTSSFRDTLWFQFSRFPDPNLGEKTLLEVFSIHDKGLVIQLTNDPNSSNSGSTWNSATDPAHAYNNIRNDYFVF